MALDWLKRRIKNLRAQVADVADKVVTASAPTDPVPVHRLWYDYLLDALPMSMAVTGFLLGAICTISDRTALWSYLGFMLLASSPIVYWLQRIERKMQEWINLQKRWRG